MKILIDTELKTIKIEQPIMLKDLVKGLKELLGDEWKEYSIEQAWTYYPYYPWYYTGSNEVTIDENKFVTYGN